MLDLMIIAVYTALYVLLHSLLAANAVKFSLYLRYPGSRRYYRLVYNLVAVLLLLPLLVLLYRYDGAPVWQWSGYWRYLSYLLLGLALVGFLRSLRDYDMQAFMGLGEENEKEEKQGLRIGWFHRFVRHPWYGFGLVLLWCRDLNAAELVCFAVLTLYLFWGSRLEEQKLIAEFGQPYRDYQQRVPGLIPSPFRWLSKAEAARLIKASQPDSRN